MSDKPKSYATCCAHLDVAYKRLVHVGGTCSDSWVCLNCGTKFWPESYSLQLRAEIDMMRDKSVEDSSINRELRAEVERLKCESEVATAAASKWRQERDQLRECVEKQNAALLFIKENTVHDEGYPCTCIVCEALADYERLVKGETK